MTKKEALIHAIITGIVIALLFILGSALVYYIWKLFFYLVQNEGWWILPISFAVVVGIGIGIRSYKDYRKEK